MIITVHYLIFLPTVIFSFRTLQEEIISLIKQEEERLERLNKEDIHKINSTVSKIPEYQEKLQGIVKMMASIDKMSRKLKKRTTYVQERQQTPTERS